MKFQNLRRKLNDYPNKRCLVRWTKSKIVEIASLESNGAIRITNVVSKYSFILPRYQNDSLNVEIVKDNHISLGSLLPRQ